MTAIDMIRPMARLATVVFLVGLALVAFSRIERLNNTAAGSDFVVGLPTPVAVRPGPTEPAGSPTPEAVPTVMQTSAAPQPRVTAPTVPTPRAAVDPVLVAGPVTIPRPADADDRTNGALEKGGYAVRLAIPAIKLDTAVEQAGIVEDRDGNSIWETRPFVAVHYGDLTALVGAPGNAVIAGHVVTLREGNVFRFLYQLDVDDQIQVWDQRQREYDFQVRDVKLVPPSDTSVMAPTPEENLTLITCGGQFDPVTRQFSDRLVVTAKPLSQ